MGCLSGHLCGVILRRNKSTIGLNVIPFTTPVFFGTEINGTSEVGVPPFLRGRYVVQKFVESTRFVGDGILVGDNSQVTTTVTEWNTRDLRIRPDHFVSCKESNNKVLCDTNSPPFPKGES